MSLALTNMTITQTPGGPTTVLVELQGEPNPFLHKPKGSSQASIALDVAEGVLNWAGEQHGGDPVRWNDYMERLKKAREAQS